MEFDAQIRQEVDRQFKKFAIAVKEINEPLARRLFDIVMDTKKHANDGTHALLLVASEIGRGINSEAPSRYSKHRNGMSSELANALAAAEKFGRDISQYAIRNQAISRRIFRKPRLRENGKRGLLHCIKIGVAHQRSIEAGREASANRISRHRKNAIRRK